MNVLIHHTASIPPHETACGDNAEHIAQLEACGFSAIRRRLAREDEGRQSNIRPQNYRRITQNEHRAIRYYFPTVYLRQKWSDYRYTDIPKSVLDEFSLCALHHVFDHYYIRTPERIVVERVRDPLLFGIIEQSDYLIAQWGEGELFSLETLVARYKNRHRDGWIKLLTGTL